MKNNFDMAKMSRKCKSVLNRHIFIDSNNKTVYIKIIRELQRRLNRFINN